MDFKQRNILIYIPCFDIIQCPSVYFKNKFPGTVRIMLDRFLIFNSNYK
jgi:hypothetical protein